MYSGGRLWRRKRNQKEAIEIMYLDADNHLWPHTNPSSTLRPMFIKHIYDHVLPGWTSFSGFPLLYVPHCLLLMAPHALDHLAPVSPFCGLQPCFLQFLKLPVPLLAPSESCPLLLSLHSLSSVRRQLNCFFLRNALPEHFLTGQVLSPNIMLVSFTALITML